MRSTGILSGRGVGGGWDGELGDRERCGGEGERGGAEVGQSSYSHGHVFLVGDGPGAEVSRSGRG